MSSVRTEKVVDFEVHPLVERITDLAPYLDRAWTERFSHSEFRLPAANTHPGAAIEATPPPREAYDPAAMAAAVAAYADLALLVPMQPLTTAGWLGHVMAERFCAAVNDYMIERWLPADPRFRYTISVAPHDPDAAVREIRRHGDRRDVAAIGLPLLDVNLGHKHFHPIYAAAAEFGLPVVVHPSGFEGTTRGPAGLGGVGPRTPEETYAILPQAAAANVGSLIFDGAFTEFPDLHVVFAGFGFDWAVSALWRLDLEWRNLRLEVPWVTRPPSAYAAEQLNLVVDASSGVPTENAWELASMLPEDVLLWGSDAPFQSADRRDQVLERAASDPAVARLLSANPARVLGARTPSALRA
jgi:predicted TIM-barrel fold metal-dependent hydrolase